MKNRITIYLSIMIGLLLISCSEERNNVTMSESNLTSIELSDVQGLIPNQLKIGKSAYYRNERGESLKLDTHFDSVVRPAVLNGREYNQERFSILYLDPEDQLFSMDISADGVYTNQLEVQKTISANLMTPRSQGNCSLTVEVVSGELATKEWNEYHSSFSFLMRDFKDVYIGRNDFNTTGKYDQIAFSLEVGIVAFKDASSQLWVFDRFED